MSGGSFNYAYHHMQDFSERLRMLLEERGDEWEDPAVRETLAEIADQVGYAASLAYEAEWLYSGDICEELFLRRVARVKAERGA